jgi:nucleoside-diphosphate kinase
MSTPNAKERTLAIIKPGAFKMRQTGAIIGEIQAKFGIAEMRLVRFTEGQAKAFYAEHAGKPYFLGLIEHAVSGPCVALILEGPNAIQRWRDAIGPTEPMLGTPGVHLRAKYGYGMPSNALHGSDSAEAFTREAEITLHWGDAQAVAAGLAEAAFSIPRAPGSDLIAKDGQTAPESDVVAPAPGASETAGG